MWANDINEPLLPFLDQGMIRVINICLHLVHPVKEGGPKKFKHNKRNPNFKGMLHISFLLVKVHHHLTGIKKAYNFQIPCFSYKRDPSVFSTIALCFSEHMIRMKSMPLFQSHSFSHLVVFSNSNFQVRYISNQTKRNTTSYLLPQVLFSPKPPVDSILPISTRFSCFISLFSTTTKFCLQFIKIILQPVLSSRLGLKFKQNHSLFNLSPSSLLPVLEEDC